MHGRARKILTTLAAVALALTGTLAAASPASAVGPSIQPVYRFFSTTSNAHFFTIDVNERDAIIRQYSLNQWRYEGAAYGAFSTQADGTVPLYRFWSSTKSSHFFTTSATERDFIIGNYATNVYKYEGIAYYIYPSDSGGGHITTVDRFYSQTTGRHFFTANATESAWLQANTTAERWKFEGAAFAVPGDTPAEAAMIDAKNCSDFATQADAQAWFDYYYPRYGDVARLDQDNDRIACETLK